MCRVLLILVLLMSSGLSALVDYSKPISVDSRIKTFVYSPNEVFTVVFSQGYYSYIEFAEGEKVKNIAVGDASSWKISPYDNKLLIMPFEVSGRTNMIITTTKKRNYIFDLISRPNYDKHPDTNAGKTNHDYSTEKDISYVIRFYYPQEEDEFDIDLDEISTPTQMQYVVDDLEDVVQENATKYNYTYVDKGVDADIIPVELFDDGYLTYFKFRDSSKIPQIFVEENKAKSPCRRLLFDGYVVIKGVHRKLFMRYEGDEVEIINRSF
ncbi:P-type conjugative transfer protein VirB9 [Wolbachia endosymbiont of Dirofilaria (Dirofilaria) immitis]|uniref:Type IV secretion system protein virB9 n=2 Tax=unclassified Wolbachia TaxID=2640676 RepID=A4V6P8_9RICK|nr:P-type conjugative transfer protein VirB9 [Wolbachia endosymbiont of Dirofilaria (Dirofilaria) immitis]CAJ41433.1 type IV secretion system protein virB9 [Wolbachia endosymbiont of Dirofilaria immitis]